MTPKFYSEIVWVGALVVATLVIALAGFASDTSVGATTLNLMGVIAIRPELLAKLFGFAALPLVHFTFSGNSERMRSAMWTCASVAAAMTLLALMVEGGIILQACSVKDAGCSFLPSTQSSWPALEALALNLLPILPMGIHAVVFSAAVPAFFYGWFLLGLDLWRHHMGDGTPQPDEHAQSPAPSSPAPDSFGRKPAFAPSAPQGGTFGKRR